MTPPLLAALVLLGSYLLGAVPFGYLVGKLRGVDLFKEGSGNIGATNVGRVLGWRAGVLVFLLDFAKGAVPPAVAGWVLGRADLGGTWLAESRALEVGAGLAAFLGHLFPVFLRFRGGKGVATATGVVAVLLPVPALIAFLVWLATVSATRYVSLASLTAAAALCVFRLLLVDRPFGPEERILTLFCLVAAGLVCVRHRGNVARLLRGTENRFQDSPRMLLVSKIIHVLALGLWFGGGIFFSLVAAPVIFHAFGPSGPDREAWAPLVNSLDEATGTRLAGAAVGPIFPYYFLLQGVCGLLAVIPALAWSWAEPHNTVHRVRSVLLVAALALVVAGWPLAQKVSELRALRYAADPAVAEAARAAFGSWHGYSLLLNLLTLVLVTVAMALAASLPATVIAPSAGAPSLQEKTAPSPIAG